MRTALQLFSLLTFIFCFILFIISWVHEDIYDLILFGVLAIVNFVSAWGIRIEQRLKEE